MNKDIMQVGPGVSPLFVRRLEDDAPVPATGRVIGHGPVTGEEERKLAVIWGEAGQQWQPGDPVPEEVDLVPFDELVPDRGGRKPADLPAEHAPPDRKGPDP